MDTVRTILGNGKGAVRSIAPDESVLEAAQRMNRERIGSLVVMQGSQLVGIITERDVMIRVVAERKDPSATSVLSVMTREVLTCSPDTPINAAKDIMRHKRIRHLPVCDGERLLGLVSIGDLNAFETERLNGLVDSLEMYITSG